MPSPAEHQSAFADALLDLQRHIPAGLAARPGAVVAERFAVYRNNVAVGLIEALRAAFPVVNRLVGEEFFAAMARAHSRQSLPSSPVLLTYGAEFPQFVFDFAPAASLPYLVEVARLEWLWLEAYHAADAPVLKLEDLESVPRDRWPDLRLALHTSTRFEVFEHSPFAIWEAHQRDGEPGTIELDEALERILVARPDLQVSIIRISAGAMAFLATVAGGGTIADGVVAALCADPQAVISEDLSLLFEAGAFSSFTVDRGKKGKRRS